MIASWAATATTIALLAPVPPVAVTPPVRVEAACASAAFTPVHRGPAQRLALPSTAGTSSPSPAIASDEELRMARKLHDIAALRDGWWGPGSKAVDPKALNVARLSLPYLASRSVHVGIAPVADGTLMIEWRSGATECTAEIFGNGTMTLTIDNPELDVYVERTLEATRAGLVDFYLTTAFDDVG